MASVTLESVDKVYPNGHVAARALDLAVRDGELLVLVGPSGCGKSTALRMVAGLETPTGGRILIGDRDVTGLPPQERDIAMVFQSYALYPHMSVARNLGFGLRMRGTSGEEIDRRVQDAARALDLEGLLERKPGQLSGGQRQRVALGRAIVREPLAFLFDEPLSNLDARLRVQTRAELARLHRRLEATMIYVTHDQEEAMTLGQRVAVLRDGVLQQVAPPMEIYGRPANRFVAGFVGSPEMNFFEGELRADGGRTRVAAPGFALEVDSDRLPAETAVDGRVVVAVRPQDVRLVDPDGAAEPPDLTTTVEVVEPLGSELLLHLARPDGRGEIRAVVPAERAVRVDDRVGVRFRRDRLHLFDAGDGRRLP